MISIIITAYKEPKTIGRAIASILEQEIPERYEIIIVAPDKPTLDAAKESVKNNKKVKIRTIQDDGQGKPSALNLVMPQAKGEIIILTDGDVFTKNIKEFLKHFKDKNVGAVSGRPVSLNSRDDLFGYWGNLLFYAAHMLRKKRDKQGKFLFCTGYLFALRKNLIKKIPPYALDDAYISECVWAKGNKIKYEENALVFVKSPTHFKDWVKQKKRNVYGEFQLKKYQKKLMTTLDFRGDISMRSFKSELFQGIKLAFSYPKSIKEFAYTLLLFLARFYVWVLAFIDLNLKKETMGKIWTRVESTK